MVMKQEMRIAVIGESVLMEGITLSLEDDPTIKIKRICVDNLDTPKMITEFRPNVIIYELGFPNIDEVLSQLGHSLGIRLVILDDRRNQVLVMDSRLIASPRIADLRQLINSHGAVSIEDEIAGAAVRRRLL